MELTKENIQTRVLQNGEQISLDKFNWDEKTRTFSSSENNLVLDFSDLSDCTFKTGSYCTFKTGSYCVFDTGSYCVFDTGYDCTFNTGYDCTFNTGYDCTFKTGSYCTFNTGSYCTFKTGSDCTFDTGSNCTFDTGYDCTFKTGSDCTFDTGYDCTFKTGSDCTFKTGSDCTFNTGSDCTFNTSYQCIFDTSYQCIFDTSSDCVVVRRDIFEVILLKENIKTILCPHEIKGYLEEHNSKWYLNGNIEDGEYIIVDNILSKVIKRKGNILKVINHFDTEESYIVEQNGHYSHGKTLDEARESLVYKLSKRDLTEFKSLTLDSILTKEESIRMYMSVTGACAFGTRQFIESRDIKEEYTIKEIIELTQGQYGNQKLKEFFSFN
jgi:hypothetical protein